METSQLITLSLVHACAEIEYNPSTNIHLHRVKERKKKGISVYRYVTTL